MEDKGGNWTTCATGSEISSVRSERMLLRTRKSAAVSVNWRGSPPSRIGGDESESAYQSKTEKKTLTWAKTNKQQKQKTNMTSLSALANVFFFFFGLKLFSPSLPPSPHNYYRWTAAASSAKPSWGAKKETWNLVVSTHFTQIRLLRFNHGLALAATLTAVYIHNEPPHTVQHPSRYSFIYYIYIYTHTYIDIQNIYIYSKRNKNRVTEWLQI